MSTGFRFLGLHWIGRQYLSQYQPGQLLRVVTIFNVFQDCVNKLLLLLAKTITAIEEQDLQTNCFKLMNYLIYKKLQIQTNVKRV